jgi:hypothetical protein
MSTIPDELLLSRIRREAEARQAALDELRSALDKATAAADKKILAAASKLTAQLDGKTVNSSAIAGMILRTQVEPGFALAEQVTLLEAKVDDGQNTSAASIEEIRLVTASTTESLAQQTLTLAARFANSEAQFTQQITAQATAVSALVQTTDTLVADVGDAEARLNTVETTYATRGYADTSKSEAITAAANDATSKVNIEAAARALADGRVSGQYALNVSAGGQVAGMTVTAADGISPGSGYTQAPSVTFENFPNTPGSGAAATAYVSGGSISSIVVTNSGSGYTVAPKVVISGGNGSGAAAVATLIAGGVSKVLVRPTSEIAFQADAFKIYSANGNKVPFSLVNDTLTLNSTLVVNGVPIGDVANNASTPPITYIGSFASAPSAGYAVNSIYKNTTDGNSYVKNSAGAWVLFLERGAQGSTGNTGPQGPAGSSGTPGSRGSSQFYATGSAWSDATADAAITALGLTKVLLDQVTISNGSNFAQTRFWAGTAWTAVTAVINGNLLVNGTVGADKIVANSITGDRIAANVQLTTPRFVGGKIELNDQCTIASTWKKGIIRVNGGSSDGPGEGGQLDVFGSEYVTVPAYAGAVLITPANVATGHVRIRDRSGADRLHVDINGLCNVSNGRFSSSNFDVHPNGSSHIVCGEDPAPAGGSYLAMRVNNRTVYVRFFETLPT